MGGAFFICAQGRGPGEQPRAAAFSFYFLSWIPPFFSCSMLAKKVILDIYFQ